MKNINISFYIISYFILSTSISLANDFNFSLHRKNYNCNSPYALKVGTQENCEVNCPNRVYIFSDHTCRLKIGKTEAFPSAKDSSINSNFCKTYIREEKIGNTTKKTIINKGENKEARMGVYFKGASGKCYQCNTLEAVNVTQDCYGYFCNSNCKQRIQKHYNNLQTVYSVLKCPKEKPLMDRFMMCWSCNEKTPIDMSFSTNKHNVCKSTRNISPGAFPFSYLK